MSKVKINSYTASASLNQDERIEHDLEQFGLFGILPYFKKLAEDSIKNYKTPKDYLEALLGYQRIYKENSRISSRVLQAGLGKFKLLEDFNFKAKIKVNRMLIHDLAACSFISENKNIIFFGQAGVGKTHLAKAIAKKAIDKGFKVKFIELDKLVDNLLFKYTDIDSQKRFFDSLLRPDLLILDEIKNRETNITIQDFLYRLIRQRYDHKSTIFTSNKDFSEWEKLFGSYSEAAIDRIGDKKICIVIKITGQSYRIYGGGA